MEQQQLPLNEKIVSVHIAKDTARYSERLCYNYNDEDTDSDSVINEEKGLDDIDIIDDNGNGGSDYNNDLASDLARRGGNKLDDEASKVSDITEETFLSRHRWKRWFRRRSSEIDEDEWDDNLKYDQSQQGFVPFSDRSLLDNSVSTSSSIGIRKRIANAGLSSSRLGRFVLRRNVGSPEYYMTLASELNNVAASLYSRKQYSTAMDLLKDAVRAVKTSMNPEKQEWQELPLLADTKAIAKKIVHGKILAQDIDSREPTGVELLEPSKLDIFDWPKSVQNRRPKWLLKPLYIALKTKNNATINNATINNATPQQDEEQQRKYGCIGAFILFNLGLIYLQRQEYPASLKYFQMAKDLLPDKDYAENFHYDYIVFISIHNNIGCIEYLQSSCDGMRISGGGGRMSQVALEEFQFAFHLCR